MRSLRSRIYGFYGAFVPQDGLRRGDQRFMDQQQRRDRYEQQRRRERVYRARRSALVADKELV
jgi:hypothetical protein